MSDSIVLNPVALQQAIVRARNWLLASGVQVVSDNPLHQSGFVSWYDAEQQNMPYVYSEITGYLTTLMCALYDETQDSRFLDSARGAGEWLTRTAHPVLGGFRCLYPLQATRFDYKFSHLYTFDGGVIVSGLVNLFRATKDGRYLATAVTAADWLIRDMQKPDGGFHAVYDVDHNQIIESDQEWSLCAGSYHTKVAIGLVNLFEVTRIDKYRDAAVRACNFALQFQQSDGRFISFPGEGGTNSHPHAYSAEGLWVVGSLLQRQDYLTASARAAQWLLDWQSPEGIIPRHFHDGKPLYNERVDVLAQTLRLAMIHVGEARLPLSPEINRKLDQLVTLILRNQASADDSRIDGGFYFGRLSDGSVMPHVNVWVTAFVIQALGLYDAVKHNRYLFNPIFMV